MGTWCRDKGLATLIARSSYRCALGGSGGKAGTPGPYVPFARRPVLLSCFRSGLPRLRFSVTARLDGRVTRYSLAEALRYALQPHLGALGLRYDALRQI